jgi:hypothetical protein
MSNISFVHGAMKICPWCYEEMSLVLPGLSLLLFVRIEQNVKIYNTLHLVFFTGYTYKI